MSEPRRRRGARRSSEAPELDEGELIAELRRRAWAWLTGHRAGVVEEAPPAPLPMEEAPPPPALPVIESAPPANDASTEAPARRKRSPKRDTAPPDAAHALRRKAWWWLRSLMPATLAAVAAPAAEAEPPRRRRGKREAVRPEGVTDLRRRAWAWFAPKTIHGPAVIAPSAETPGGEVVRAHLKGVLEALIFASEHPLPARELARVAQADLKLVKALLAELVAEYHPRGLRLDEVGGGFVFRTSPVFAPFVREQVAKKPVKMSRAQIETLAIVAYRQPVTRPEIDEVRGVDSGAVLKSLLERELLRILGKKDEPGRPMLYGTTGAFLEFFGLKALGDLPTLREFTELNDESRRTYERELGEDAPIGGEAGLMGGEGEMRREARPAVVDVAALEDDPTLEKEEAGEGERAESTPEPAGDEPAGDEPAVDEPVADEPVVDEPVVEEPLPDSEKGEEDEGEEEDDEEEDDDEEEE